MTAPAFKEAIADQTDSRPESFSVLGASRVGIVLAHFMQKAGLQPQILWNHRAAGLSRAEAFVRFKTLTTELTPALTDSDWIVIAVRDDALSGVASQLAALITRPRPVKIFHTSGFLDAAVLEPLSRAGALTGAMHPILSIPTVAQGIRDLPGAWCGCEGELQSQLLQLAARMGVEPLALSADQKRVIHIAAVFLNNYSVALIAAVQQMCTQWQLPADLTTALLRRLSEQAIENAWDQPLGQALTGPLARGDYQVVKGHLRFLRAHPELRTLYRQYVKITRQLLKRKAQ